MVLPELDENDLKIIKTLEGMSGGQAGPTALANEVAAHGCMSKKTAFKHQNKLLDNGVLSRKPHPKKNLFIYYISKEVKEELEKRPEIEKVEKQLKYMSIKRLKKLVIKLTNETLAARAREKKRFSRDVFSEALSYGLMTYDDFKKAYNLYEKEKYNEFINLVDSIWEQVKPYINAFYLEQTELDHMLEQRDMDREQEEKRNNN